MFQAQGKAHCRHQDPVYIGFLTKRYGPWSTEKNAHPGASTTVSVRLRPSARNIHINQAMAQAKTGDTKPAQAKCIGAKPIETIPASTSQAAADPTVSKPSSRIPIRIANLL